MGWDISLSPSKIGIMKDCPRCFYDANKLKIEQPRGIFPSLPGGVDRVMKNMIDSNRSSWPAPLVQEMAGKRLWGSTVQIDKLRNWRSGLKTVVTVKGVQVSLIGALDDLVLEADGLVSPYDTKTKGDLPKDDGLQYYNHQLDIYALMLRENGMPPSGKGYLNYWFPVLLNGTWMEWGHKLFTVSADADRGLGWVEQAVTVLQGGQPDSGAACGYCRYADARVRAALASVAQSATQ